MKKENSKSESDFDHVRFVLVRTSHPGNIGASARAMKNMGFGDLSLVNPKDFPSETAYFRAKAAKDVLKSATLYPNLYDAIKDCHLVIGTSARNRKIPWPLLSPRDMAKEITNLSSKETKKVALIFGREDRGLTNEELGLCNMHVHIPTHPEYTSLNLSQAVQLIAYEIRGNLLLESNKSPKEDWDVPLADFEEIERLIEHFDELMKEVNFYDEDNPRKILIRVRRFFKKSKIDHMEANIFRGLFASIQKRLNK